MKFLATLCLLLVACSIVAAKRQQSTEPTSLIEAGAKADSAVFAYDSQNLACVKLGYASACPNVDWATYQWIQTQAINTRIIDYTLENRLAASEGTRQCKRWFKDLMCRYAYPKCSTSGGEVGGPCRSECERFSKSCPGMAMSCAAFELDPAQGKTATCWISTTTYAYGYKNHAAPSASMGLTSLVVAISVAFFALRRLF